MRKRRGKPYMRTVMRKILPLLLGVLLLVGCQAEKYPQYKNLSDFKGLEVYVWSTAENSFSCVVMEGTNRNKTIDEVTALPSVTIDEMKVILDSYDTPDSDIFVMPFANPTSEFDYEIDDEYCKAVSEQFDGKYSVVKSYSFMDK